MRKSILLWALKALILLVLTLIAYFISPILALFVVYAEESEVTGFPSLYPGKPRAFLQKWCRIWQSQDAPVDEWWYGDYYPTGILKRWFTNRTYEAWYGSPLRWWTRVLWLCRNAAYGFGALLGYDGQGMVFQGSAVENDTDWKSGKTTRQFWSCVNEKGQIGWSYRAKLYYTSNHYLLIKAGYKLFSDPVSKYPAMQWNPFQTRP